MIRTRFAPSPTGYVHIGNIRTALFAYLFAKHESGAFILRIEDTDRARFVEGSLETLLEVMKQLGIQPDEGYYLDETGHVKERGEYGPYLQSKRLDVYHKYANELLEKGKAYYCYCSSSRLEELRKEQTALKKPPMYDQHCRNLNDSEGGGLLQECINEGRKPVVRMAIPVDGQTIVHDVIYGNVAYDHKVLDDQVILKSDGFPTYHLAVVIDDHLMEITHVIRTDEWLPSTPKHLLLYKAFGWTPPQFVHLPLVLNLDKSKLSKRQGDVAVEEYLSKGYLPEALINFLAFLGWNPKTEQEIFSMNDLIREFDLSKVHKSGAVFDVNKLDWMNGKYIRQMKDELLAEKMVPFLENTGWIRRISNLKFQISNLENREVGLEYFSAIAAVEKERLKKLADIVQTTNFYFSRPKYNPELLPWRKSTLEDARLKLAELRTFFEGLTAAAFSRDNLETKLTEFIQLRGYDTGSVLWPLRVALTGLEKSAGPFEVAGVLAGGLGADEVITRLTLYGGS